MLNMAKQKRAMAKYLLVSSWEFALSDHGREGGVLPFHFLVCVYEIITKHSSIMHSLLNRLSHIFEFSWYHESNVLLLISSVG